MHKPRRELSEKDIEQLKTMSAYRIPFRAIANILGFKSPSQLDEIIKKTPAARQAVEDGRANSTAKAYQTLYSMATSGKNFPALAFWLKTQEGVREVDRIELTGKDGKPLESATMTREELAASIAKRRKIEHLLQLEEETLDAKKDLKNSPK